MEMKQNISNSIAGLSDISIEWCEGLKQLPIKNRHQLPACPAVYVVCLCDEVLYVGQSRNLKNRWMGHHRLKQFPPQCVIFWLVVSETYLRQVEYIAIEKLKPKLNGQRVYGKKILRFTVDAPPNYSHMDYYGNAVYYGNTPYYAYQSLNG